VRGGGGGGADEPHALAATPRAFSLLNNVRRVLNSRGDRGPCERRFITQEKEGRRGEEGVVRVMPRGSRIGVVVSRRRVAGQANPTGDKKGGLNTVERGTPAEGRFVPEMVPTYYWARLSKTF